MLTNAINILSAIFDLFIMIFYLKILFEKNSQKVTGIPYFLGFFFAEVILFINSIFLMGVHIPIKGIYISALGIGITFFLTFYYDSNIRTRFFVAFSFQAICALTEILCACILVPLLLFTQNIKESNIDPYITTSSKIIALLIILIIDIFLRRKEKKRTLSYNVLILFTPILSLIILLCMPHELFLKKNTSIMCITIISCLTLLNIINYHLLNKVLQIADLKEREKQLNQQIDFQTSKYQQISSAYRSTRSLLHDTKKHFLYIQEGIRDGKEEQVLNYLQESLTHLEQSYSRINTGNLVIDAFISNYMTIARQEAIGYITDIQVESSRIPIEDYDLCVVLGNLLDNSLNATRIIPVPNPRQIEIEIFTSKLEFVIHIKNTRVKTTMDEKSKLHPEELYHGFGITNIQNIVEKYSGTYSCFPEERSFETIIVLPIMAK